MLPGTDYTVHLITEWNCRLCDLWITLYYDCFAHFGFVSFIYLLLSIFTSGPVSLLTSLPPLPSFLEPL